VILTPLLFGLSSLSAPALPRSVSEKLSHVA
jgi:hypothetical protein